MQVLKFVVINWSFLFIHIKLQQITINSFGHVNMAFFKSRFNTVIVESIVSHVFET